MEDYLLPFIVCKRKFSLDEDNMLRTLVKENGIGDWVKIAERMQDRDSRQCKERWFHYLAPHLTQQPWTRAEDILLEAKAAQDGHRWKHFEVFFPGRTDVGIKNRYNLLIRRKKIELAFFKNACGDVTPVIPKTTQSMESRELVFDDADGDLEVDDWADVFQA
jgi:hypothetical protein